MQPCNHRQKILRFDEKSVMGILGVPPGRPAVTIRQSEDDPCHTHLGESVEGMDQLAADNLGEESLRLFEITAENWHERKP
jgi:hypothetical protein